MKTISLTRGLTTVVDDEDYDRLIVHKWHVHLARSKFYAVRDNPSKRGSKMYMHHIILEPIDGLTTDHKDGDSLNNQSSNLRHATQAQQMQNLPPRGTNGTPYKGVRKNGKGWQAKVKYQYKDYCLGTFATPEEAARVYDAKARELFGELARLNFPCEGE